jgi:hypothetical protein
VGNAHGYRPPKLHLPCKGNPKQKINYFSLPFQGARKFFPIYTEADGLGYYG